MAKAVPQLRLLLVSLSVGQLTLGITLVGIGGWLVEKPNEHYEMLNLVTDSEFGAAANHTGLQLNNLAQRKGELEVAGYCFIASGVAAFIAFLLALFAAFRSRAAVPVLLCLICCTLALKAGGAALGQSYHARVEQRAAAGWRQLQDDYYVPLFGASIHTEPEAAAVASAVNFVQVTGECCGAESAQDVATSPRWRDEVQRSDFPQVQLPLSCCPVNDTFRDKVTPEGPWEELAASLRRPSCPVDKESAHTRLCPGVMMGRMQLHLRCSVAMATGIVAGVYDLLVAAAAVVFAVRAKN